jgi:hypothetical protein
MNIPAPSTNTNTNEAAPVITLPEGTKPVEISFRKKDEKTGTVHPAITIGLPVIDGIEVYSIIAEQAAAVSPYNEDGSENPEFAASKTSKVLAYFADLHNDVVKVAANKQLNTALKNGVKQLGQADIDLKELDFWAFVYREPASRKMFSDELVQLAVADFEAVLRVHGRNTKGQPISPEGIKKAAKWSIVDRFKDVKTSPQFLTQLQGYLDTWYSNSDKQEVLKEFYLYLIERIETYLNVDQDSLLAAID